MKEVKITQTLQQKNGIQDNYFIVKSVSPMLNKIDGV